MEIVWLPRADQGLDKVIEYLEIHWTEKHIKELEEDIKSITSYISKYPHIGIQSGKKPNLRKAYPNQYTYLIYRIRPRRKIIEIINFRATKQDTSF